MQENSFLQSSFDNFAIPNCTDWVNPDGLLGDCSVMQFREHIWSFYNVHGRPFIWRSLITPYRVVVSEIMLQQTQTERVKKKFAQFTEALPTFEALAAASTREVLTLWQGLGYNRRGLALHKIAQIVVNDYEGRLPTDPAILQTFPGIGPATAASICAFAFDMPTVFIETNIRAVYLHLFFKHQSQIPDKQLLPLIEQTVDKDKPRHWYYALMDYGVMLKKRFPNPSRKSRHHAQQSKFEGSERQIRGAIVRILTQQESVSFDQFCKLIDREPRRIQKILNELVVEGLIKNQFENYFL